MAENDRKMKDVWSINTNYIICTIYQILLQCLSKSRWNREFIKMWADLSGTSPIF